MLTKFWCNGLPVPKDLSNEVYLATKGEVRIENHSYSLSMSRMDNGMLNNVSTKNIYLGGMRFFFFFFIERFGI